MNPTILIRSVAAMLAATTLLLAQSAPLPASKARTDSKTAARNAERMQVRLAEVIAMLEEDDLSPEQRAEAKKKLEEIRAKLREVPPAPPAPPVPPAPATVPAPAVPGEPGVMHVRRPATVRDYAPAEAPQPRTRTLRSAAPDVVVEVPQEPAPPPARQDKPPKAPKTPKPPKAPKPSQVDVELPAESAAPEAGQRGLRVYVQGEQGQPVEIHGEEIRVHTKELRAAVEKMQAEAEAMGSKARHLEEHARELRATGQPRFFLRREQGGEIEGMQPVEGMRLDEAKVAEIKAMAKAHADQAKAVARKVEAARQAERAADVAGRAQEKGARALWLDDVTEGFEVRRLPKAAETRRQPARDDDADDDAQIRALIDEMRAEMREIRQLLQELRKQAQATPARRGSSFGGRYDAGSTAAGPSGGSLGGFDDFTARPAPGAAAGPGDVLLEVEGRKVETKAQALQEVRAQVQQGSPRVTTRWRSNGQVLERTQPVPIR